MGEYEGEKSWWGPLLQMFGIADRQGQ